MYVYIVNHKQSLCIHKFNYILAHSISIDLRGKSHYSDSNLDGIPGSIGKLWRYLGTVLLSSKY